jgi:antitoxin MazE
MRIAKWGNSLAVRLPTSLIKALGLREGEEVEITVKKKDDIKVFLNELQKIRTEIPLLSADFKFDREEANAR